jgi:hypothetical protein
MSARFYRNPMGRGFAGVYFVRLLTKGSTIRVVAFRISHPSKQPSRRRRLVQRFLNAS